jgi:hypothetical protein
VPLPPDAVRDGVGAATSPLTKYDPEASFIEIVNGRARIKPDQIRNLKGQWAKASDLTEKKVVGGINTINGWLNESTPMRVYENGVLKEVVVPRWRAITKDQGGFIKPDELIPGNKPPVGEIPGKLRVKPSLTQQVAESVPGVKLKVKPSTPVVETPPIKPLENPTDPFYNVNRMNISPENKVKLKEKIVGEFKPEIEKVIGTPLTNAEVMKKAQVINEDLIKTVGRATTEEMGAAQLRLRQSIAKMADSGEVTPELLQAIKTDASFAADKARLLQERGMNADPITPNGKLKQTYLDNILRVESDLDKVLKAAKGVDWEDPKQTTEFYRKFIKPTAGEWIDKVRYNSMLSSPNTHIINISSNLQGTGILTPIQKTVEGGLDAVASAFNPSRKRTRFAGEGLAYAKGYFNPETVKNAFRNFYGVMSGKLQVANPDTRQIPLGRFPGKLGEMVGPEKTAKIESALAVSTRLLEGMDQLFRGLTEGGLKGSQEYRASKGIKTNLDLTKEADKLLFRGKMFQSGEGLISNALGAGGNWVKAGTMSKSPLLRWMAKLSIPFINVGTNLAKAGLESNPISGAINMIGNDDKIAQAAKMIMGGSVMAAAVPLAMSDRITFGEPTSVKEKQAFRQAGMLPYSIKIGDTWYQYSKMHPLIGFQLATVAALTQAIKEGRISEGIGTKVANGLFNSYKFFMDQTYQKNVGDFMGTMNGDVEGLSRLTSNYPSQFIPFRGLMGWMGRIIDQYQRQPDTSASFITQTYQQLASQLPFLSTTVPERKGTDGQPIKNKNVLINSFSPWKTSPENDQYKQYFDLIQESSRLTKQQNDLRKMITSDLKSEVPSRTNGLSLNPNYMQTQEDIVRSQLFKQQFEQSGQKWAEDNGKIYMNDQGTIKVIDKLDFEKSTKDALFSLESDRLKRAGDTAGWLQATNDYVNFLQEYQKTLDPQFDQAKIITLQNKIEDLGVQAAKYVGQGGFTKGKKSSVKMKVANLPKSVKFQMRRPTANKKSKLRVQQPKIAPVPIIKVKRTK